MKTEAIIAAAGLGTRLKAKTVKALIPLAGKPLFLYSVELFAKCPGVSGIILVVPPERCLDFEKALRKQKIKKPVKIVCGGSQRAISVRNGLTALDKDTQCVLVHDAARPFVTTTMVKVVIAQCKKEKAVTVAVPVKPTIKRVDPKTGYVAATLDRRFLWEIQTPQGFLKEVLIRAHGLSKAADATDDTYLVERLGENVKVIEGDYRNIKITTPEDLELAEGLIKRL